MGSYDYDLFVIGAGSGGTRASRIAAGFGARVAVAEERYLGGTCVNVGCVPKKLLVYASHFADDFEDAAGFGWTVGPRRFDWSALIARKDAEIARLNRIYERLIEGAGAEIVNGTATIVDDHTVAVADRIYTAEYILIAAGGWPVMPDVPGIEHAIDSNGAFFLDRLPRRAVIVGGGYIAVEFAGIFSGLGVEVTQLYRGPLFLRGFDHDVRTTLAEEMAKRDIDLRFNANVSRIEQAGGRLEASVTHRGFEDAGPSDVIPGIDLIMYATGRAPKTAGLGLENVAVARKENGAVAVDAYSKTSVDSIYAIGDITDRVNLTPMAIREGHCFAETVFNHNPTAPDHADVPTAVFSQPSVGACGLTEADARARYGTVAVYRSTFRPMKHTLSGRDERTMVKLVVEPESDRVVGCHMVGPDAGEIMQGIGIAMKCGATKAQFDATLGIHPTTAEELVTLRDPVAEVTAEVAG